MAKAVYRRRRIDGDMLPWVDISGDDRIPIIGTVPAALNQSQIATAAGVIDNGTIDAFARLRMSAPYTLFDSKQIVSPSLVFDDAETSGGGTTSTHAAATASTTLSVSATTAGTRVRQQKTYNNYQPGKSQLCLFTGVLGAGATGITRRVGLFDGDNGLFFELNGTTLRVAVRTKTSGTAATTYVDQDDWNIDTVDGAGGSGVDLDTSKANIYFIDYEWLGVGRVRFGVFVDGMPVYVHQVLNANNSTQVYMSTPNLPVRYEISNDGNGGAASLVHICSAVISEGGQENSGFVRGITRGITGFTGTNSTNIFPLVSLKLNNPCSVVDVLDLNIISSGNSNYEVILLLNPTVAGSDAASWVALTNSGVSYDITRDNTNTLTGGTDLGGLIVSQKGQGSFAGTIANALRLGTSIAGTSDEMVLAVRRLTAGIETYYARLTVRERI